MKNLSKLGKTLSRSEQKEINGGFWGGCQAGFFECKTDRDCCNFRCGGTIDGGPAGPISVDGWCNFFS